MRRKERGEATAGPERAGLILFREKADCSSLAVI
jgi:hypothetical protein